MEEHTLSKLRCLTSDTRDQSEALILYGEEFGSTGRLDQVCDAHSLELRRSSSISACRGEKGWTVRNDAFVCVAACPGVGGDSTDTGESILRRDCDL